MTSKLAKARVAALGSGAELMLGGPIGLYSFIRDGRNRCWW